MPKSSQEAIEWELTSDAKMQHYNHYDKLLVHDPRSSLRAGDVVSISSGVRRSKHVKHIVRSIIAPFGEPIEARPPIPSINEVVAEMDEKKRLKDERKKQRLLEEKSSAQEERANANKKLRGEQGLKKGAAA